MEMHFISFTQCFRSCQHLSPSMEYLNALASVCEAAQRISVPPDLTTNVNVPFSPSLTFPQTSPGYYNSELASIATETPLPVTSLSHHPGLSQATPNLGVGVEHVAYPTSSLLTPPPTPDSDAGQFQPLFVPQVYPNAHLNPVLKNFLAYAQFQHYLDEKWPETSLRRGNAVIRASLYSRIVDALQGGETTARFRYWVKKTEFFLIDRTQPGVGYGACLCIPVVKSRGSTVKKAGGERHSTYKLVARLEDFVHIIGTYHNDQKGHHGIRRTYAMVQQDFRYVPRAAVSKFIELCDICSLHRPRSSSVLRPLAQQECLDGNACSDNLAKATRQLKSKATSGKNDGKQVDDMVMNGETDGTSTGGFLDILSFVCSEVELSTSVMEIQMDSNKSNNEESNDKENDADGNGTS